MSGPDMVVLNKIHDAIGKMVAVLNQVSDYSCPGRNEMNKSWSELANEMRKLNKPPTVITAEDVKRLREHTGEGMIACKKALFGSDGDFDKAVEYLRTMGNI